MTRTVLKNGIMAIGRADLQKFVDGKRLSRNQQIRAFCYDCMGGYADGAMDCKSYECPLYPSHPYNPNREKLQKTQKQIESARKACADIWQKRSNLSRERG